jgi:membrane associated rhomboid family serine protease
MLAHAGRVDFERGMRRTPPLILLIIAANVMFVLAIWSLYQIGAGFLTPYVDNSAHVGGLAGGAAASLMLSPRLLPEGPTS